VGACRKQCKEGNLGRLAGGGRVADVELGDLGARARPVVGEVEGDREGASRARADVQIVIGKLG